MKRQYALCGIGNALVDTEIEINDVDLDALSIEKGVMTLIDDERFTALLKHFQCKAHKQACGGSAANTIITAQQFGAQTYYTCRVASDETGLFYARDLLRNGVTSNLDDTNLPEGDTGMCLVMITPDAERTMNTFLGITATLSPEDLDKSAIANSEYIYLEGYLAGSETGLEAAIEAKKTALETNTKTALSFSDPNMIQFCRAGIERMLEPQGVDVLFCNHAEAQMYTGEENPEKAAEALKSLAKISAITLGKDGALITTLEDSIKVSSPEVTAIDTNGAGDTFAGAFLAGLSKGLSLEEAGTLGCKAAAKVVTKFGPRLTTELAKEILTS
jgi:sugar/nucleoside kinase (ribokinase family)